MFLLATLFALQAGEISLKESVYLLNASSRWHPTLVALAYGELTIREALANLRS